MAAVNVKVDSHQQTKRGEKQQQQQKNNNSTNIFFRIATLADIRLYNNNFT